MRGMSLFSIVVCIRPFVQFDIHAAVAEAYSNRSFEHEHEFVTGVVVIV